MSYQLYKIIQGIWMLAYIFSFFFSLKLIKNKRIPKSIRIFPIYTTVGIFCVIFVWLCVFDIISSLLIIQINKGTVLFHFSFLAYFIWNFIINKKLKITILLLFIISFLLTAIEIVNSFYYKNGLIPFYPNVTLTIFCLIYYLDTFNNLSTKNLLKDAHFWFVTAIFVGVGVSLPLLFISQFSATITNDVKLSSTIGPFFYFLMHILFIKAISCSLKTWPLC